MEIIKNNIVKMEKCFMKKILIIVMVAILLFITIINFRDDSNFKDKSNLFRVEKIKWIPLYFFVD
ncbi:hypothetical protein [uncultured Clostridium sp.]|uniref:hypothetical protein n=1 Tax=uncultured Clostridium sp. TaxID=59620 RepID=UPI002671835F|nr:hypothetical protein [uncultured Clostridium sp.]